MPIGFNHGGFALRPSARRFTISTAAHFPIATPERDFHPDIQRRRSDRRDWTWVRQTEYSSRTTKALHRTADVDVGADIEIKVGHRLQQAPQLGPSGAG
jgi:hypothetical protein